MKTMTMRFPGDPPATVTEMTRAEFVARHPRSPIQMRDLETGWLLEEIPLGADEVICDLCSGDPGDTVVEMRSGRVMRGYCLACATESWYPHCEGAKP